MFRLHLAAQLTHALLDSVVGDVRGGGGVACLDGRVGGAGLDGLALAHLRADLLETGVSGQLHTGGFLREYLAVTESVPQALEGTIDAPIARLGTGAKRCVRADGQRAVTHYRVEAAQNGRALVRLLLDTGRTHQIRVHLAHLGCPICGDYLYGSELASLGGRFALHSVSLTCVQPITGARVHIDEPVPKALLDLLRG